MRLFLPLLLSTSQRQSDTNWAHMKRAMFAAVIALACTAAVATPSQSNGTAHADESSTLPYTTACSANRFQRCCIRQAQL
jgi:hypothetical protein